MNKIVSKRRLQGNGQDPVKSVLGFSPVKIISAARPTDHDKE
jgi:hypothetical protein